MRRFFKNKRVQGGLAVLGLLVLVAANAPGARLAAGHLFVGNSSGVATDTAVTGDVSIDSAGATAIGSNKVTSAMIAANTVVSADIDTNVIQVANVQLSKSQLEALRATPIVAVAAAPSNYTTVVFAAEAWWDVTTTAETITGSNDDIVLEFATAGTDVVYMPSIGFIDQTSDQGRIYRPLSGFSIVTGLTNGTCNTSCLGKGSCLWGNDDATGIVACATASAEECVCSGAITPAAAEALQLKNNGDGEFSGGNAANTLSFRIWYAYVPAAAFSSGG